MDTGRLYRLKRGNQTQTVGIIIKGATSSVTIYGSQSKPTALTDMVDCTDSTPLTLGAWPFSILPEYIAFDGTLDVANTIEIVGMSYEDLSAIS